MEDGRPEILLVERDPHEEELALLVFGENDLGECVRVARTIDSAAALLFGGEASFTPHLILLGLTPDGHAELDFARRLRSEWQTQRIPIVAVASSDDECRRIENTGLAISSFIVRPVEFDKIVGAASAFSLWWRALARARESAEPPVTPSGG